MSRPYDPARDDYNWERDNWECRVARGEVPAPDVEQLHRDAFKILKASGDAAGMRAWAADQEFRQGELSEAARATERPALERVVEPDTSGYGWCISCQQMVPIATWPEHQPHHPLQMPRSAPGNA